MICMKQTSLITFIQIGQLLLVKFVSLTLSNGIVEVKMMQMIEDNMSDLENLKFLITEYMIQINQMNDKHTFTDYCRCLCYSLMSHNWWVTVKQQKKPSMSISQNALAWKIITRVSKNASSTEKVKRINKARKEDEVPEDDNAAAEKEGIKLVGEAEEAMHNVHDMDCDTIGLSEHIVMLNEDQRWIFEQVADHLNYQWRHEHDECKCKDMKPLHMFVSGVGGTGKSFSIETLRNKVKEIWKHHVGDDTTCAVAAPTGLTAYNVGEMTVHRLLQLPIEHEGKRAGYWPLSKVAQ